MERGCPPPENRFRTRSRQCCRRKISRSPDITKTLLPHPIGKREEGGDCAGPIASSDPSLPTWLAPTSEGDLQYTQTLWNVSLPLEAGFTRKPARSRNVRGYGSLLPICRILVAYWLAGPTFSGRRLPIGGVRSRPIRDGFGGVACPGEVPIGRRLWRPRWRAPDRWRPKTASKLMLQ